MPYVAIIYNLVYYCNIWHNKKRVAMAIFPEIESYGYRLLEHLFSRGDRIFSTRRAREVAAEIGIPLDTLNVILSRLQKQGTIHRLRRGLYTSVGMLGKVEFIHPYVISAYLIQPSAISHWSALEYHGFTDQISSTVMASTPLRVYTPSMRKKSATQDKLKQILIIDGVYYEYITIKKENFELGLEKIWMDPHFQINITDKERTIIDLFAHSRMFGGMGECLGILEDALANISTEKLIKYAQLYGEKALAKRIGWALDQLGVEEKYLQSLLDISLGSYCQLDPGAIAVGPCDSKWMIQNNLNKGSKK
jgi:predicted transcriptional regulator of viral defense system